MSLVFLFHYLLLNMFQMLLHPSSGACDLPWIHFMCCIGLVRCVLVLRCGSTGVVWYPYAGWSTSASACVCVRARSAQYWIIRCHCYHDSDHFIDDILCEHNPVLIKGNRQSSPVTGLDWPGGFHEPKVPRFHDNGTGWWWGQPYSPAAFNPRKCSCYSFLLEAESTSGP